MNFSLKMIVTAALIALSAMLIGCDKKTESGNQSEAAAAKSADAALPAPDCGEGRNSGEVRNFGPDNLYTYNNGAADLYIKNGFKALAARDCNGPGAAYVSLELFDMGSPTGARAMFDYDRGKNEADLKIGDAGFAAGGAISVLKGKYLIRAMTFTPGDDPDANLKQIAEAAVKSIK